MGVFSTFVSDGELNVLEDILTEAPDQDDELYNPESEREISDKKGTTQKCSVNMTEKPASSPIYTRASRLYFNFLLMKLLPFKQEQILLMPLLKLNIDICQEH